MPGDDNSTGAGRTLDGRVAEPLPSTWARSSSTPRVGRIGQWSGPGTSSGRFATIDSMNSASSPGHGPSPAADDNGDENDEVDRGESWFAGGERSGISVENPNRSRGVPGGDMVRDLLRRAAEAGPPPGPPVRSNIFTGGGHRLGSDEEPSAYIPDPDAPPTEQETAIRHITFWREGFSIEDGELLRYDDAANAQILAEINSGRAPPSILNVNPGQPVELRVAKRTNEDYAPPQSHAKTFGGAGHRLGAPVPSLTGAGSSSDTSAMPGSFPALTQEDSHQPERMTTRFEVDQTKPMTSIQLRLADGTRMVCRMNMTHTVEDIRNFINASRPENLTRAYTIGTTFPNRTLDDSSATIESAGLANSVIVQRWV